MWDGQKTAHKERRFYIQVLRSSSLVFVSNSGLMTQAETSFTIVHLSPCDHPRLLAAVCTTRGRERRAALGRLELIWIRKKQRATFLVVHARGTQGSTAEKHPLARRAEQTVHEHVPLCVAD